MFVDVVSVQRDTKGMVRFVYGWESVTSTMVDAVLTLLVQKYQVYVTI